jgi:lipopolysaccharide export system permease protein
VQMIYISNYKGRKLGDSTIIDLSHPNMMQLVQAKAGNWDPRKGWNFQNANVYLVSNDTQHSSASHWDEFSTKNLLNKREELEKKIEDARGQKTGLSIRSAEQNFPVLYSIIKEREKRGMRVSASSYLDMWEKITLPLSCLVIILSAVPLALTPPRQGSNRGFVFAIVILFLYYTLRSVFIALGKAKFFTFGGMVAVPTSMMLAAWMPILLMGLIGVGLVLRKSRVL